MIGRKLDNGATVLQEVGDFCLALYAGKFVTWRFESSDKMHVGSGHYFEGDLIAALADFHNRAGAGAVAIAPKLSYEGSGYENLERDLDFARASIRAVLEALAQTTPHGRDYLDSSEALRLARRQHSARVALVQMVQREIESISMNLCDQHDHKIKAKA